jgi:hypothetical protein
MGRTPTLRRFRANPIEYGIFATVTLLFAHSVYSLLYTQEEFRFAAMTPMASNPVSESRAPAGTIPAFANIELKCDGTDDQVTRAGRLRLSGPLCGGEKAVVMNDTNRFAATVFTDTDSKKFSTDYIPLNTGRNVIKVDFATKTGSQKTSTVVINRE